MSKLFLYDFECTACGAIHEDLQQPADNTAIPCPQCGKDSIRTISGTRVDWKTMGVDPDFPGAAAKWEKMQRQKAKSDKQDGPNLWMH